MLTFALTLLVAVPAMLNAINSSEYIYVNSSWNYIFMQYKSDLE